MPSAFYRTSLLPLSGYINRSVNKLKGITRLPAMLLQKLFASIWVIKKEEFLKFILNAVVLFCILFIYALNRTLKDVLVVTIKSGGLAVGGGVMPFIKTYGVMPFAILAMILVGKVQSNFSRENRFYILFVPLIVYFVLFGFVLYPNAQHLQVSTETAVRLYARYPAMTGFLLMASNLMIVLHYIMSEMFGVIGISFLFWANANETTPMDQASRIYPALSLFANSALILAGMSVKWIPEFTKFILPNDVSPAASWMHTVKMFMLCVGIVGIVSVIFFRMLNVMVLNKENISIKKKEKRKIGMVESVKIIAKSPKAMLIAALIFCYGTGIGLVETPFKEAVSLLYLGDKVQVASFFGQFATWTGVAVMFFTAFFGASSVSKYGWKFAALITPIGLISLGSFFFILLLGNRVSPEIFHSIFGNPIKIAVVVGAVTVIANKMLKYVCFDSTKEMVYITFPKEERSAIKTVIEVLGGRLGKTGSAGLQSTLLMVFQTTTVVTIMPVTSCVFVVICLMWIFSVKTLSKYMDEAKNEPQQN